MFRYFKDYLSFSRSEKNALIILAFIFILIILLNIFLPFIITPERKITAKQLSEIKRIDSILNDTTKRYDSNSNKKTSYRSDYSQYNQSGNNQETHILFVFDPNSTTAEEWRKLHIPEKVIKTIINYRQKGGRFYKPEDLKKIYGLSENVFENLEPYIKIKNINSKPYIASNKISYSNKILVELNSASEVDLDKLPFIGSSYAKRIIKYRQLLGGYYKKEQLLEVYGFDSVLYNKIKEMVEIDESRIVKIAINLADISLMGKHPYIGYKIARTIIDRRNIKGPYKNIQEVKETIGNESYNRLFPYLKLWD